MEAIEFLNQQGETCGVAASERLKDERSGPTFAT